MSRTSPAEYGAKIPEPVTAQTSPLPYQETAYNNAPYQAAVYEQGAAGFTAPPNYYEPPNQPATATGTYDPNGYPQTGGYENTASYETTGHQDTSSNYSQSGPVEWTPPAETQARVYPQNGAPHGYAQNANPYGALYPQDQGEVSPPQPYGQNPYLG